MVDVSVGVGVWRGGGLTGGTDAGETGEGEGPEVGVVGPAEVGVYAAIRWRRDSCRMHHETTH